MSRAMAGYRPVSARGASGHLVQSVQSHINGHDYRSLIMLDAHFMTVFPSVLATKISRKHLVWKPASQMSLLFLVKSVQCLVHGETTRK